MEEKRIIIGLTEKIKVNSHDKEKTLIARIDTGATTSSIDMRLASELRLGPVVITKLVKSAHGKTIRPVIIAEITLAGKKLKGKFTIADRSHMKYKVLVGQNILKKGFLIDPMKK